MTSRIGRLFDAGSWLLLFAGAMSVGTRRVPADEISAPLPEGVKVVWDAARAVHEATATRERFCINGLWRWQPARPRPEGPPVKGWGHFKVPGCWPGITDYMQKDSQTLYPHPDWKDVRLAGLTAAWYEREITIPDHWADRRIALSIEYLNSYAAVFVDGRPAGEVRFPAGEVELTAACRTGGRHRLSLLVLAMPLKAVMLSYNDTASARQVKGTVARRQRLCGDVYLEATPIGSRIARLIRGGRLGAEGQISFDAALQQLDAGVRYTLRARLAQNGHPVAEITSKPLEGRDLDHGRITFTEKWKPDRLWDLHTPGRPYVLSLSLLDAQGRVLDTALDERFGVREFWIDGRDFYLNGTRIFLSAVPFDNAQVGAASAGYQAARESLERLKSIGINFVYTHNYGCEPGSHLGFEEILRAADDVGMLVAFSQPHFSHYEWRSPGASYRSRTTAIVAMPSSTSAGPCEREPSLSRLLRHEPQRDRLRGGHESGPDRRPPRSPYTWRRGTTPASQLRAEGHRPAPGPGPDRLPPRFRQPRRDARQQLLSEFRADPGAIRLVRTLGDAGRQADVHLRIRRTVHLGLGHVPRLVQGRTVLRQRQGPVGILPRRVERPVPRRPVIQVRRDGESGTLRWAAWQFQRPATSGTAGITLTSSAPSSSTTGTP